MRAIVEIHKLTVSFDALKVLEDISVTVERGKFVILIGPSGCGKSTLLRVISGVIPGMIDASVKGTVRVANQDPLDLPAGTLDFVPQEKALLPWRTAQGNVQLGLELLGNCQPEKGPEALLESVGLGRSKNSFPHELSGGMKQRVAFVSALVTEPPILLMDEPLGALDALTREEMWVLLERIHREKPEMTMILVTHHIEEAAVLGDTIIVMVGNPDEGCPSIIAEKVEVDVPRPRIDDKGTIAPECLEIANSIRAIIHEEGRRIHD